MPRGFARFANNVVLLDRVRFAHLCRDGSVEDEAVQPAPFAVDDLEDIRYLSRRGESIKHTSRSRARPSSVSKPLVILFRCRFKSVAIRIAIPSIIHVRSCSKLSSQDAKHKISPRYAETHVFSGPNVHKLNSRYACTTSTLLYPLLGTSKARRFA